MNENVILKGFFILLNIYFLFLFIKKKKALNDVHKYRQKFTMSE